MRYLIDHFVPLLAADSDLDGLVHETRRHHYATKLVCDAACGFGDW